jgi:hypothetical protein
LPGQHRSDAGNEILIECHSFFRGLDVCVHPIAKAGEASRRT